MENQASLVEVLFERTSQYTKKSIELYKLKTISKSADVISSLAVRFALTAIAVIFFLITNIGIALWVGEQLGRGYYGFFCVAGFYAFIGLIIYVFRNKWIKEPLRDTIVFQALN